MFQMKDSLGCWRRVNDQPSTLAPMDLINHALEVSKGVPYPVVGLASSLLRHWSRERTDCFDLIGKKKGG